MHRMKIWLKNRNYSWSYKLKICLPLMGGLLALDWITKLAVMKIMNVGDSGTFIPGFLRFHYVLNLGAAYGSNEANPPLAIGLATIFTIFILALFLVGSERKWLMGLSFVLGGSMANLLGRSWSPWVWADSGASLEGAVIDFLQWDFSFLGGNSYIFNLADVFVISGIVLIALVLFLEIFKVVRNRPGKSQTPGAIKTPSEMSAREAN